MRDDNKIYINERLSGPRKQWKIEEDSIIITDNLVDIVVSTVTFTNIALDTVIEANIFLYTTGGILENIPLPSSRIIHSYNNRIFAISNEDLSKVFYSKENISGEGLGFSDALYIQLLNQGEDPTALTTLDDKLLIFKPSSLFVVTGDGANDLGTNSTFSKPTLVSSHVGCVNPSAIIITSNGCFFNSKKGIYLLDRGLNMSYIGKEMFNYRGLTINSIVQIPDQNQIRFLTENQCFVYFHELGQWTVFTNYAARASTIWNNSHVFIRYNDRAFCREVTNKYKDESSNYSLIIETGWIKINLLQRCRVYNMQLLGRKYTDHILKVTKYDNYNEELQDVKYFDSTELFTNEVFGEETLFGQITPFAGENDNVYLYTMEFDNQKVNAFKLKFEDLPLTGEQEQAGSGYSLSNLGIEIGIQEAGFQRSTFNK